MIFNDITHAKISPLFKKKDDLIKANYRPVSILTAYIKTYKIGKVSVIKKAAVLF